MHATSNTHLSRALLLTVFLLALAVLPTARAEQAYDIVKTAQLFAIGGVGVAGTQSGEEAAFRELLKQPDPATRCKKLLDQATPAGQMYALLGLRLLDKEAFQAALPRYKDDGTMVQTASGCMLMKLPASNVAKEIEKGQYQ